MIPLPGLVNAKVTIGELQDVGVECASFMRVTDIEDWYVQSGSRNKKVALFRGVFWVLSPVGNSDHLTPAICVFSRQTWKLCQIQRIISEFVIVEGCRNV